MDNPLRLSGRFRGMVNETHHRRRTFEKGHQEPPMTDPPRPPNRETENEDQRTPKGEGQPPRPATEPRGSEGTSNPGDTATDPATGKPNA